MSFAEMKKKRENLDAIATSMLEDTGKRKYERDTRFWYPKLDDGNGYAVIRFLPEKEGETAKYVQRYSHGFKLDADSNSWYIENCPTTVGVNGEQMGKCPMCEANTELYKTLGKERASKIVSAPYPYARKRKMKYTSNVYVVSDPANPENEGKVFLYEFGTKIFDKLKLALNPQFPKDPKFNPFNLWSGANFELKIRKVDGQVNYDSSSFEACAPLDDDDAVLEKIYNSIYSLEELISPDKYKDYDTLKARVNTVLGVKTEQSSEEVFNNQPEAQSAVEKADTAPADSLPTTEADEPADDNLAYFQSLVDNG